MGTKPEERMMEQLERRAEAISGEFSSQAVANTLWAYATMGRKPGERVMEQLEGRAEAISGEFKPQEVANTLWALATMGRKPGERMMKKLEGRVEVISGEFNSQHVANTLWATCCFSIFYAVVFRRFCIALSSRLLVFESNDTKDLRQMHQLFIDYDMNEGLHTSMPASFLVLKEKLGPSCKAAFVAAPAQPSWSQQQVSDTLRGMGLSVEDEFRCPKSGYSIDMRVQDKRPQGTSASDFGPGWAIEYDGPSHFLACKAPTGATLIKRRHLELLGYRLVSVPFWEWDGLAGVDDRRQYLEGKLR
jgi:hypothetical protein